MLICPRCKGKNINQYRMMTGKIWCSDCGFEAPHKEIDNPFDVSKNKFAASLKSCPFCGSKAEVREVLFPEVPTKYPSFGWDIHCTKKKCFMESGGGFYYDTPELAIEAWNNRSE